MIKFYPSRKALFALFVYILTPTYAILAAMINYPELSRSRFIEIMKWIVVIGIVLIIISQVQVRYKRGSLERYLLNIAYVCVSLLWLLALFGGKPYIEQYWGEYRFRVVVWKILLIAVMVGVLNVLYFTVEYVVYRKGNKSERFERRKYQMQTVKKV